MRSEADQFLEAIDELLRITGGEPLVRRDLPELLGEELRRLDEDDIYAATARKLASMRVKK